MARHQFLRTLSEVWRNKLVAKVVMSQGMTSATSLGFKIIIMVGADQDLDSLVLILALLLPLLESLDLGECWDPIKCLDLEPAADPVEARLPCGLKDGVVALRAPLDQESQQ